MNRQFVRGASAAAIVAVTALGTVAVSPATGRAMDAVHPQAGERVAGDDRYDTAAQVAVSSFEEDVETVYIATGEDYADALATGPAAVASDAPLLLVRSDEVPAATRDALDDLDPERIVLAGGEATISVEAASELEALGDVDRVAGDDRYDTAAQLATDAFSSAEEAYIATGEDFADALAGGVVAAASDAPVLLARPAELPTVTAEALDSLDVVDVTVLGGEAALSDEVVDAIAEEVDGEVSRIAGDDRFETAAELAARLAAAETAFVATGRGFADALAAVPAAASVPAPLVLVEPEAPLPASVAELLDARAFDELRLLGGDAAMSDAVLELAERAIAGEPVCIDLNAADPELLTEIRGIGDVLAGRVVDGRPWDTVADLTEVSGIGERTLEGIVEQGLAQPSCP